MIIIKSWDKGLNFLHTKFQQKRLNGIEVKTCLMGAPFSLGHSVCGMEYMYYLTNPWKCKDKAIFSEQEMVHDSICVCLKYSDQL